MTKRTYNQSKSIYGEKAASARIAKDRSLVVEGNTYVFLSKVGYERRTYEIVGGTEKDLLALIVYMAKEGYDLETKKMLNIQDNFIASLAHIVRV